METLWHANTLFSHLRRSNIEIVQFPLHTGPNNHKAQDQLKKVTDQREVNRHIRRLALSLKQSLGISDGFSFIYILGDGSESNNTEALETWVSKVMPEVTAYPPTEQYSLLYKKLLEHLSESTNASI